MSKFNSWGWHLEQKGLFFRLRTEIPLWSHKRFCWQRETDVFGGWELPEDGVAGTAVTVWSARRFLADRSEVVNPGAGRDTRRECRFAFRASTSGWTTTMQLNTTFRKGPVVRNKVVWFKSH